MKFVLYYEGKGMLMMVNTTLKSSLILYPLEKWDAEINSLHLSKAQFKEALMEILIEYGKYPVTWNDDENKDGYLVTGSNGSYIGYSMSNEKVGEVFGGMSIASEDIGDAEMAAEVILRTYFYHLLGSQLN